METKQKQINQMQDLLTINYDAEEGYKTAAEEVKTTALSDFFKVYSKQRYEFGHEIKNELRSLGAEIVKGTSIGGDLHNSWVKIKSFFTGHDEDGIISECLDLEKSVVKKYEKILKDKNLDDDSRKMLQSHLKRINEAIDKIQELHHIAEE